MRFVYAIKNMICILCHAFHVQSFISCQRLILDHLAFNFWHHLQMLFKTIQYCMASFHMELTKMHWIFEAIMLVFTKKGSFQQLAVNTCVNGLWQLSFILPNIQLLGTIQIIRDTFLALFYFMIWSIVF